jgi:hypothetical protein
VPSANNRFPPPNVIGNIFSQNASTKSCFMICSLMSCSLYFFSGVAAWLSPRLRARGPRQARSWLAGVGKRWEAFLLSPALGNPDPSLRRGNGLSASPGSPAQALAFQRQSASRPLMPGPPP